MGVDPGLGATGWGVVELRNGKFRYVDSGVIRTRSESQICNRLDQLFVGLQSVARKHRVNRAAVESGYVGHGPQAAMKLGQARAAAILALTRINIEVSELAPRSVKLSITGRGGAAKAQVGYMVGTILGLQFDAGEEDISDALAVALCEGMQRNRILESSKA